MSAVVWDKVVELFREGHLDEVALVELSRVLGVVEELEEVVAAIRVLREHGLQVVARA